MDLECRGVPSLCGPHGHELERARRILTTVMQRMAADVRATDASPAPPPTSPSPAPPEDKPRARPWWVWAALLGGVAVAAGGVYLFGAGDDTQRIEVRHP